MRRDFAVVAVLAVALLASGVAVAHHGSSGFDMTKVTTLQATVTEVVWSNPHIQIRFDAADEKGNVQHYDLERIPPSSAIDRGWTRKSLKAGDMVTISFNPSKNGTPVGYFRKAVFADGREVVGRDN